MAPERVRLVLYEWMSLIQELNGQIPEGLLFALALHINNLHPIY